MATPAGRKLFAATWQRPRQDRLIHERNHDTYKSSRKLPEPGICPACGAVFKQGRWQWMKSPQVGGRREICQACRRTRDNYPAGIITITGSFARSHAQEILNLVRREADAETAQHPLHRLLRVQTNGDRLTVTTTDIHLPKRLGEALHRAYKGRLAVAYEKGACFVRVGWTSRP